MEINHYGDTILGAVAVEDIVEGRMVCLTSHTWDEDYGSLTDLPGCKLADTTAESTKSRYVITFAQDNRSLPIYVAQPHFNYALRYGFDQSANAPFSATVYITHLNNQEGLTIPSGSSVLLFGEGEYTVPSGAYIYSAALLIPGTQLEVANTANDGANSAGKLKEFNSGTIVAEVIEFDEDTDKLTFKILH